MGRFTPGTFTNYITRSFREPRLVVCTDPHSDFQAIKEASYVNMPVISLCDTDSLLHYVDVAIPTNNKGKHALGLIYWLFARAILRLRGSLEYGAPWDVMVDMFFYRDPEEIEKENEAANADEATGEWNATIEETDWTIEGSALDGLAGIAAAASEWTSQAAAGDWNAQATSGDWADDEVSAPAPSTGWD